MQALISCAFYVGIGIAVVFPFAMVLLVLVFGCIEYARSPGKSIRLLEEPGAEDDLGASGPVTMS